MSSSPLASVVEISSRFNRAANISYGIKNLHDDSNEYIITSAFTRILKHMANHYTSGTYSFLWTGNYGAGKSSAATFLGTKLSTIIKIQRKKDNKKECTNLISTIDLLRYNNKARIIIPVVSKTYEPIIDILDALLELDLISIKQHSISQRGFNKFASLLKSISKKNNNKGVFIIIDEMGKYLENVAKSNSDIHFWQNLAEFCNHSGGEILLLGILHRSFRDYSNNLSRDRKNDWNKVEGRFVDISFHLNLYEQLKLTSKAVTSRYKYKKQHYIFTKKCYNKDIIASKSININDIVKLTSDCWPLHPFTALILADGLANAEFSQSQRSLFSFVNSGEPDGLLDFISKHHDHELYEPWKLWDYLHINYNILLTNSTVSQTWVICKNMIQRVKDTCNETCQKISKIIAICELLGIKSIRINNEMLSLSLKVNQSLIIKEMATLITKSLVVYRKHINSYVPYEGSDFDIEIEYLNEYERMNQNLDLIDYTEESSTRLIIARRHSYDTGAMRTLKLIVVHETASFKAVSELLNEIKYDGFFVVIIKQSQSHIHSNSKINAWAKKITDKYINDIPVAISYIDYESNLSQRLFDLHVYKNLANLSTIQNDTVAKKEVSERALISNQLFDQEMSKSLQESVWQWGTEQYIINSNYTLTMLASDLMDQAYPSSPIVKSELLNSDSISTSAKTAVKRLMYKMIEASETSNIYLNGTSAEATLYNSTLIKQMLYVNEQGAMVWKSPSKQSESKLELLWLKTTNILINNKGKLLLLSDLIKIWKAPPFGVKLGLVPLLLLTYYLTNQREVAFYLDGVFRVSLEQIDIDHLLQLDEGISLRYVKITPKQSSFISEIARGMECENYNDITILELGKLMVSFVYGFNSWTKRTNLLDKVTIEIRNILLRASDPHKLFMKDLYSLFELKKNRGSNDIRNISKKIKKFKQELSEFYYSKLEDIEKDILTNLSGGVTGVTIQERAMTVIDKTGDLKCKAFAQRLASNNTLSRAVEQIGSLAINKPVEKWNDLDYKEARQVIISLCRKFIEIEMSGTMFNETTSKMGYYMRLDLRKSGDIPLNMVEASLLSEDQSKMVKHVVKKLSKVTHGLDRQVMLAAVAELILVEKRP